MLREIHALSPGTLIGAVTIDDRGDTRTAFDDFQEFSRQQQVELYVATNRKHSEELIRRLKPDLCLVVCWYWLIDRQCIEAVPRGLIGIHYSPLPRYRGGSPLVWQIINDEKEVGISFFSLTPGMDDGPVWMQASVPIDATDYVSNVLSKLEATTLEKVRLNFPLILDGRIKPIEQRHELATYCTQRFPSDGNINWSWRAREVHNFIRAQSDPYPGAFTYLERLPLKIWRSSIYERPYYGVPGQVARITNESVVVVCGGNSAINLEEIELQGTRCKAPNVIASIKTRFSDKPSS